MTTHVSSKRWYTRGTLSRKYGTANEQEIHSEVGNEYGIYNEIVDIEQIRNNKDNIVAETKARR